jgi:signal peptidase
MSGTVPYRVYVIHTGSMSPTIPLRSAVIVREHQYHVGQVITFRVNGELVTHRLLSFNADGMTNTKGDGNKTADPWHVQRSAIVGGVVLAPHEVGFLLVYLKTPAGAASILLLILFIWQTFGLDREFEEKERQREKQKAGLQTEALPGSS